MCQARLFQQVGLDEGTTDAATLAEVYLNQLAEPTAVVVAQGSGIAKSFQQWVGLQHLTLHACACIAGCMGAAAWFIVTMKANIRPCSAGAGLAFSRGVLSTASMLKLLSRGTGQLCCQSTFLNVWCLCAPTACDKT